MSLFFQYVKCHKKTLLLYIVCVVTFAVVFFLSRSSLDAVLYGALLCAISTAFFTVYDFYHFSRQHKRLICLQKSIDSEIDHLPEPRSMIDKDYTDLLVELHRLRRQLESQFHIKQKELKDYFSLWVHQVKTPISAIDLLLQSKGTAADKTDKAIRRELFNVEEYVSMAMSYVRIGDMAADFVFEETPLDDLIKETLKKYAPVFIGKKVAVNYRETAVTVVTDKKWCLTVLAQILSNALKYTPENGTIFIYVTDEKLFIEDTGIGIKPEDLPRVFQKGFTGYNGRQYSKSTGQGLYLCKTIMDRLSHNIAISSDAEGTRVMLDFSR